MRNAKCKNGQKRIVPVVKILDVECATSYWKEKYVTEVCVKGLDDDGGPAQQKNMSLEGKSTCLNERIYNSPGLRAWRVVLSISTGYKQNPDYNS